MIKSTKQKRLRPKLDRRNAIKNCDYQAADSPSSSSSFDDSSTTESRFFSLSTVSAGRSFRIEGVEGEFDRICRSLGLSIEDFAIPAAAWEASKVSSPSSQLRKCSFGDQVRTEDEELSDSLAGNVSGISDELTSVVESKEIDNAVIRESKIEARANDGSIHTDSITVYRIKGFRPPHLAPPPGVSQRAVDDGSSTWDILKAFGPADYKELDDFKQDDGITGRQMVGSLGYAARIVSESCSDTSNDENDCGNNGDSCNAMTEPIYCISPGDSFSRKIDSWQKGDFLGSVSFGTVYEGFTDDGFFFAVKEVSLLDQGSQGKQRILQLEHEISLLSQFRHENIVRYLGTEKDDSKLYIFLELVTKGSLQSLYQKYCLRDSQVSAYTRQILNGLNYLHRQNVVHRDIKCANILVDASGSVKLADFGLAKSTKLNDVKSCKGTAFWMAPEVVNQKSNGYGLAADIWSLGCTVLEMLTGHVPYSHLEAMQAIFRIGRGEPPPIPNSLSRDAQDFILKCLQVCPDDRPSAAELLEHPFIQKPPSTFPSPASQHYSGRVS